MLEPSQPWQLRTLRWTFRTTPIDRKEFHHHVRFRFCELHQTSISFGGVLHLISCFRKWSPSGNIAPKWLRIAVQSHEVLLMSLPWAGAIWINYNTSEPECNHSPAIQGFLQSKPQNPPAFPPAAVTFAQAQAAFASSLGKKLGELKMIWTGFEPRKWLTSTVFKNDRTSRATVSARRESNYDGRLISTQCGAHKLYDVVGWFIMGFPQPSLAPPFERCLTQEETCWPCGPCGSRADASVRDRASSNEKRHRQWLRKA